MTRKLRPYTQPPQPRRGLIPRTRDSAALGFLLSSLLWLMAATGVGALLGAQLLIPDIAGGFPPLTYGRLAPVFFNAIVYGWLASAAIGAIFYITPRLTGTALFSERLGNFSVLIWNLTLAIGIGILPLGATNGRPLAEFPGWIDVLVVLALVLVNVNFWATLARRTVARMYVSLWYFATALIAFPALYVIGSATGLGGATDALVNAYYARALEGYVFLASAVGALYYVVPRIAGDQLFSDRLAALGFWTFVALFGFSGAQHLVWGPIPYWLQTLSVVASVLLLVPAFAVVANLAQTMRGRWHLVLNNPTAQLSVLAIAFLLVTALLEAILPLRNVSSLVGATDWLLGVFVIATFGAYGSAFFAMMQYAMPRLMRRAPAFQFAGQLHVWASFAGTAIAGLTLLLAGIVKGSLFVDGVEFGTISQTMTPLYAVVAMGLSLLGLGAVALAADLFLTFTSGRLVVYELPADTSETDAQPALAGPAAAPRLGGTAAAGS